MKRSRDVEGKKVVITGAASGIGYALATRFTEAGAAVVLADVNEAALEVRANELAEKLDRRVYSLPCDVTDFGGFKRAVDTVVAELGPIDIFVNNAGVAVKGEFFRNSAEEIDRVTRVNYLGVLYGSKIVLEHFDRQGYGHLVNVASVAGLHGIPKLSLYSGTKAGVIGFSQAIRFECRRHGIHVSLALPSSTDTPMLLNEIARGEEDADAPGMLLAIPMCRTEDVAEAIFQGIRKRRFMIFPTFADRSALFFRNHASGLYGLFIRAVGFRTFKRKMERLREAYGLVSVQPSAVSIQRKLGVARIDATSERAAGSRNCQKTLPADR